MYSVVNTTLIPNTQSCAMCNTRIAERAAIAIRIDKNYYFHNHCEWHVWLAKNGTEASRKVTMKVENV